MKQHLKILFFLPLLAVIIALASWSDGSEAAAVADAGQVDFSGVGEYVSFDYRKDTITDAETNTINIGRRDNSTWNTVTIPSNFLSLYTYDIKLRPVTLTGTLSQKLVLDASNMRSGTSTDWTAIDSVSVAASARVVQLRGTDATATRYRIRVVGAGTQSSTYQVWTFWKKKN